jgi:hypothetical protein
MDLKLLPMMVGSMVGWLNWAVGWRESSQRSRADADADAMARDVDAGQGEEEEEEPTKV